MRTPPLLMLISKQFSPDRFNLRPQLFTFPTDPLTFASQFRNDPSLLFHRTHNTNESIDHAQTAKTIIISSERFLESAPARPVKVARVQCRALAGPLPKALPGSTHLWVQQADSRRFLEK